MAIKCAVCSCLGLGDGLITLTLSNNLRRNGYLVTTYHPFLEGLHDWFPSDTLKKFPEANKIGEEFAAYDKIFLFFEKSPWMSQILSYAMTHFPEKITVINPIATFKTDYPYWENAKFSGRIPFVENLVSFSKNILQLEDVVTDNGIAPPAPYIKGRFAQRVVLHPSSSRPGKNWPMERFLELSCRLQKKGFSPSLILTKEEREGWPSDAPFAPEFATLGDLAGYVFESGAMIGNDSGIGHLASCLGLPTVTVCRSRMSSSFWRPGWSMGKVVCPPSWVPNIKGLRLRDKHWKKFVTTSSVLKAFEKLV